MLTFLFTTNEINVFISIYTLICVVSLTIFTSYPSQSGVRRLFSSSFSYFVSKVEEQVSLCCFDDLACFLW